MDTYLFVLPVDHHNTGQYHCAARIRGDMGRFPDEKETASTVKCRIATRVIT
ncbi:MAG: hypothetical protein FWF86_01420 [Clostridia bacterium]|nr:hypothetical protein [Clostridia bacterium]